MSIWIYRFLVHKTDRQLSSVIVIELPQQHYYERFNNLFVDWLLIKKNDKNKHERLTQFILQFLFSKTWRDNVNNNTIVITQHSSTVVKLWRQTRVGWYTNLRWQVEVGTTRNRWIIPCLLVTMGANQFG